MGDAGQGTLLTGQVKAVKPGTGILIGTDGTISVDSQSIQGVMKLGQTTADALAAFNGYKWPTTAGSAGQQLETNGAGILSWADSDGIDWTLKGQLIVGTGIGTDILLDAGANDFVLVPDSTTASGLKWRTAIGVAVAYTQSGTPTSPVNGQIWYDCSTGAFKVYQSCVTPFGWTDVSRSGFEVLPANVTSSPAFTNAGSPTGGTSGDPWLCSATTVGSGSSVFVVNTVTVTGLAPYQFVPIVDLNFLTNGGRFSFTNQYADISGTLVFQTVFRDTPASAPLTTYTANIKIGYNTAYVRAVVNMVETLTVTGGVVTGPPYTNNQLTYLPGIPSGGVAPRTLSYKWYADGVPISGATGLTYTVTAAELGKLITAETTANDSIGQVATGDSNPIGTVLLDPGPLTVTSAGTITPTGDIGIGFVLLYNQGTYSAGIPPFTTSWVWKRDGVVIPGSANTSTYTTVLTDSGKAITVEYTVTDSRTPTPGTGSLTTAAKFPSAEFPPSIWNPLPAGGLDTIPGYLGATYNGTGTSMSTGGCIQVSVNGGPFSAGPTPITTGQTFAIQWATDLACGGAPSGTTITGFVTDSVFKNEYSITIARVPAAFSYNSISNVGLSTVQTSVSASITGTNVESYLTYGAASTGSAGTFQGSTDGGGTWNNIPASGTGFPVPLSPATLLVRQTSSGTISTTSTLVANVGDGDNGPNTTSGTFTVQTVAFVPGNVFYGGPATFTAPPGVTSVAVSMVGGGGAGGAGTGNGGSTGGAGGGGGQVYGQAVTVVPGSSYAVTVGGGGGASTNVGSPGGTSSFSGVTATGGGAGDNNGGGGAGGAGGSPSGNAGTPGCSGCGNYNTPGGAGGTGVLAGRGNGGSGVYGEGGKVGGPGGAGAVYISW